jgi:hypothetical protein
LKSKKKKILIEFFSIRRGTKLELRIDFKLLVLELRIF